MKNTFFPLLVTLTAISMATQAQARTFEDIKAGGVLRVVTPGDIPGFSMLVDGRYVGYEPELLNAVAASLGLQVSYQTAPADQFAKLLDNDQVDVAVGMLDITSTREKKGDFTISTACSGVAIASKLPELKKPGDLVGRRIAVVSGTLAQAFVQKLRFEKTVNVYPTYKDMMFAMLSGTNDATFTYTVLQGPLKRFVPKEEIYFGPQLWSIPMGMMVQQGNHTTRRALNQALAKFMKSGAYLDLSQKYFATDVRCKR